MCDFIFIIRSCSHMKKISNISCMPSDHLPERRLVLGFSMGWFKYEAKCVARLVDQPPVPRRPTCIAPPTVGLFQNISQDEDDRRIVSTSCDGHA